MGAHGFHRRPPGQEEESLVSDSDYNGLSPTILYALAGVQEYVESLPSEPKSIEQVMEEMGAVKVPPDDDGFEAFLDRITEFDPATKGFEIVDGVVVSYPKVPVKEGK